MLDDRQTIGKRSDRSFLIQTCVALTFHMQDGYTLETLDIHTIEDGVEKVIIHNVRTSSDNLPIIHLTTTGTFEGICWCPN